MEKKISQKGILEFWILDLSFAWKFQLCVCMFDEAHWEKITKYSKSLKLLFFLFFSNFQMWKMKDILFSLKKHFIPCASTFPGAENSFPNSPISVSCPTTNKNWLISNYFLEKISNVAQVFQVVEVDQVEEVKVVVATLQYGCV